MKYKPYPEYKDSGVEWIGEIPENWDIFKLKHVVNEFVSGGTPSSDNEKFWSQDDNDGIHWVAIGDMSNREFVNETNKKITVEGLADKKLRILKKGTILYSIFASLGKVSILNINATTNQAILGLILSKKIHNSYLKYYLKFLEEPIIALSNANTQNNLNSTIVKNISMSLPENVTQQDQIASFLDKKTSKIDKTIEKDKQLIELLKEKRTALINHVVTKGLDVDAKMKDSGSKFVGFIPNNWNKMKLKQIVSIKITDGPHETPELVDEGIPFMSAESVKKGKIDFSKMRGYISPEIHKIYCNKCKPQKDDIFMVKSGATTGNVAIVETNRDFSIWSPLALIRANKTIILPRLLYYILLSDYFKKTVEISWSYGTQQNIGMGIIENLDIIVPDIIEQEDLLVYLEKEISKINEIVEKIQNKINLLEEYKKSLIHHAVTGKLM